MTIKDRVLVVEDEKSISGLIKAILTANGYDVITASTGNEAFSMISSHCPDLVVLDLGLPDMDGMEIIKAVRSWTSLPIIVVSARSYERDKVQALDMGADDYVTKPFSPAELTARVDALLRRAGDAPLVSAAVGEISQPPFLLNMTDRVVEKNGKRLKLTQLEYQIMKLFMENPDKALTREEILDTVWGRGYFGEVKIVDVNIRRLRLKIEDDAQEPRYIATVWGTGYKWSTD